jgi:hypothetical protein
VNLRGAKPIQDPAIKEFISHLVPSQDLYNGDIQQQFVEKFFNWINSSELNSLKGLDKFTNRKLTAGTAQTFDHFYWANKTRRFRFYKGEFMYHSACLKNGGEIEYLENADLDVNDAVIVSVPFSDWGTQRPMQNLLDDCDSLEIPVLLDFAYYPCTKDIDIDLAKHKSINTVAFSISKAFAGAEFLRVGLRLQRQDRDDGIDVFNSVEMVNRVGISIADRLTSEFSIDYNWHAYNEVYKAVCEELELEPTDCVMFGLGGDQYQDYNRGGSVNRVCVSDVIGEKLNGNC